MVKHTAKLRRHLWAPSSWWSHSICDISHLISPQRMKTTQVDVSPKRKHSPPFVSLSYRKGLAGPGDAGPILAPLIQVSISCGHLLALPRVLFQSKLSKVIYVVYMLYFIHINHETKSIGNRHSILIIICNLVPQRLSMYRTANKWFKKKPRSLNLVLYLLVSIKVCRSGNSLSKTGSYFSANWE